MTGWILKMEDRWTVLSENGFLLDLDTDCNWVEMYEWEAAEEVEFDAYLLKTGRDHVKLVAKIINKDL